MKKIFVVMLINMVVSTGFCAELSWEKVAVSGSAVADECIYPGGTFNNYLYIGSNNTNGAKMWRSSDGTTWESVTTDGFGDINNTQIQPLHTSFNEYLYVYTYNADETTGGTRILRSLNGTAWSQVNANGFGSAWDIPGIRGYCIYSGTLYMGTCDSMYGGEVWYTATGAQQSDWTLANTTLAQSGYNETAYPGFFYNGYLYCGVSHSASGPLLYRSSDTVSYWESVTITGSVENLELIPAHSLFNNYMYVGTCNNAAGCEIWRSADGSLWTNVVTGGFANSNNTAICSFSIPGDGYLYATTANSYDGTQVYRTEDGTNWTQVNVSGFSGGANNCHCWLSRTLYTAASTGYMYAGTWNMTTGGELWRVPLVREEVVVEDEGKIVVVGSEQSKGAINPDKGEKLEVYFKGTRPGKYTLRIYTVLGELIYDEKKDSLAEGTFSWIPEDIASGIYIVHVEGPGVNIHKKMAILK